MYQRGTLSQLSPFRVRSSNGSIKYQSQCMGKSGKEEKNQRRSRNQRLQGMKSFRLFPIMILLGSGLFCSAESDGSMTTGAERSQAPASYDAMDEEGGFVEDVIANRQRTDTARATDSREGNFSQPQEPGQAKAGEAAAYA